MMEMIRNFMKGRYGNDQLNLFLVICGCISTLLLTLFVPGKFYYLRSLGTVFYIITLIRTLSKNHEKRRKENAKFLEVSKPWRLFIMKKISQKQDTAHRYYNCPQCHRTLRVPKGRGKINITCPHCAKQFTKRT
ncbi:MAG: hypothetical protein IJN68_03920 [Clostridia bacterium]|nr:hypothetical protein [Oscillospiraceae bacterium]MBQ7005557.1 hypothetical protein [Clostridia bacterium]